MAALLAHQDPSPSENSSVPLAELPTPALVVDSAILDRNLATMAAARPGTQCRPHVKAHKTTALAQRQAAVGHLAFTAATPREIVGLARAGLGHDLLLANETLDSTRLRAMADCDARVTVAVDSVETIDAAAANGIRAVLIDVNVGLPRCVVNLRRPGRWPITPVRSASRSAASWGTKATSTCTRIGMRAPKPPRLRWNSY